MFSLSRDLSYYIEIFTKEGSLYQNIAVKRKILVQVCVCLLLISDSIVHIIYPTSDFYIIEKLCGRIQAETKYERYMLALIRDVVRFLGKAAVTIEN